MLERQGGVFKEPKRRLRWRKKGRRGDKEGKRCHLLSWACPHVLMEWGWRYNVSLCQKLEVVLSVRTAARQLNQLHPRRDAFRTPVTPPVGVHAEVQCGTEQHPCVWVGNGINAIRGILCSNPNRKSEERKQCGNQVCVRSRGGETVFSGQQSAVKKDKTNRTSVLV